MAGFVVPWFSGFGRGLIRAADDSAGRTLLDAQEQDDLLDAIAALSMVADRYIYGTGAGTVDLGTITSFARTILDDANALTALATLGAAQMSAGTEYTVASGAIDVSSGNPRGGFIRIDTESDASSDTLFNINGGTEGAVLYCTIADNSRITTFDDGTGNLRLAGNFVPGDENDTITLLYSGTRWLELSRATT